MNITFIRHGNTGKAATDLERQLTEAGIQQAMERRRDFYHPFDLVLSSSAVRARDTAAIVGKTDVNKIVVLEELYLPTDQHDKKAIDDMFAELSYAPLRAYRDADLTGALFRYGEKGATAILHAVTNAHVENVLVVGHAVLLNSIVAYIAGNTDHILDANLGETAGFRMIIDDENGVSVELVQ